MASVFRKLVRRESRNADGSDKNGCKAKGDDHKSERKDGEISSQPQESNETRHLNSYPAKSQGTSNGVKVGDGEMSSSHAQRVRAKRLMKVSRCYHAMR